jgi:hypothetical protein
MNHKINHKSNFLFRYLAIIAIPVLYLGSTMQNNPERVVVKPKEIDEVLNNPGIGFNTFQRFNGDTLNPGRGWTEGFPIVYQSFNGDLTNKGYPQTTTAYWRVYWKFMEPEERKYRWDLIDEALDTARNRGQKLILRIAPYGTGPDRDVPDYYRKMVGSQTEFRYNNPVNQWVVDPEDPRYAEYFGGLIREIGKRYDGHPDLEAVDISIVGAWGEGAGSKLLSPKTREALVTSYTGYFKKTPLIALLTDEKTNTFAVSQGPNVGWRVDCIGDLGFWAKDQHGWTHMLDYYPHAIQEFGVKDAWKTAPVSLEICGTFLSWRDVQKYTEEDVKYIFNETLKWRISSFNAKSSRVPEEWEPLVNEWLKKMGYRFALRRLSYPKVVGPNGKIDFQSWWENKGVAPCYVSYPLAIRLKNGSHEITMLTKVDIRSWLPGDNIYNDVVYIPSDFPSGEYVLEIALLNKDSYLKDKPEPAVKLAIEGITDDGWYTMGKITVKR